MYRENYYYYYYYYCHLFAHVDDHVGAAVWYGNEVARDLHQNIYVLTHNNSNILCLCNSRRIRTEIKKSNTSKCNKFGAEPKKFRSFRFTITPFPPHSTGNGIILWEYLGKFGATTNPSHFRLHSYSGCVSKRPTRQNNDCQTRLRQIIKIFYYFIIIKCFIYTLL